MNVNIYMPRMEIVYHELALISSFSIQLSTPTAIKPVV